MKLNSFCLGCLAASQERQIRQFTDEEKKIEYLKKVFRILSDDTKDLSAPALLVPVTRLYEEYWGKLKSMEGVKREFNDLLLSMEESLELEIRNQEDALYAALCYARIGNYIDFSALKEVSPQKLLELFRDQEKTLDEQEYRLFLEDLECAKRLVYLTDNCGEILLDKLVIKILKERYPGLSIQVLVRGEPVTNDATYEDAAYVGLTKLVPVMGNGSKVAGTELSCISREAREKIETADLLIAKGQGNFETLHGCGLNVYYLFLCKCEWFVRKFQAEPLEGMFVNEKRIRKNKTEIGDSL